ncbi:hypothetical protein ACWEQG_01970 [Microbispora sp. NPDC004025]
MQTRHHLPVVTIRLMGAHDTRVLTEADAIHVLIPGLLVVLRDRIAAWQMLRVWRRATAQADAVFNGETAAPYEVPGWKNGTMLVHSAVSLTGMLSGVQIYGRTPKHSPSGCGELKVQVGALRIICDDRAAFDRQADTWAHAASLVPQVWPDTL